MSLELLPMKYSVSIVVIVFKWLKTQLNFYKVIINKNIFLWTEHLKPLEIYILKEILFFDLWKSLKRYKEKYYFFYWSYVEKKLILQKNPHNQRNPLYLPGLEDPEEVVVIFHFLFFSHIIIVLILLFVTKSFEIFQIFF